MFFLFCEEKLHFAIISKRDFVCPALCSPMCIKPSGTFGRVGFGIGDELWVKFIAHSNLLLGI